MKKSRPPCGTYAALQRHKTLGEEIDESCREAGKQYQRNYRLENPEKFRDYAATQKAKGAVKRPRTPAQRRDDKLRSNYGITSAQWEEIFEWQGRVCLASGAAQEHGRKRPWHVDHDHEAMVLRGILIERSNRLLAQCGDTAEGVACSMTQLLAYLHASGHGLSDEQLQQVVDALLTRRGLVGEGAADADRAPRKRHAA